MSKHIPATQLALYSRGDLGFWHRRMMERHLSACEECSGAAAEFVQVQESLARAADCLPPAIDNAVWQSLASEMSANIRLGLAAGECVSSHEAPARGVFITRPRLSFALAGLTALAVFLAMEHPAEQHTPVGIPVASAVASAAATLEASGDEVMVQNGDRGLSMPAPVGSNVIRTVSAHGAVRSRYVDDTGVTIVNVYAE